jgi:xanthine/uracil permease
MPKSTNMTIRLSKTATFFAGVQWLLFMFANTVVIPLSIGAAFHESSTVIMASMKLSFMYTGIACILQALIGHRYPLMEGQSGLWWGVLLSLSASAAAVHLSLTALGGGLATGIILSGITVAILGALGIGTLLKRLFTPVAMSVFLFLLAGSLDATFLKGMVGLSASPQINLPVAGLSFFLVILVAWVNVKGRGMLSNFSILAGITVGWILYTLLFPHQSTLMTGASTAIMLFPLGKPNWELSFVITAFLAGLLNTANTVATLRGAEQIFGEEVDERKYRRSFVLTGINNIVAGMFGMVPYAPYTSALGFLEATRILDLSAFIVGGILFFLLGLVPFLIRFFATLPISVGDAVLFVAYLQLIGTALKNLSDLRFNAKTIYRFALPLLLGFTIMSMPSQVFTSLPMVIRPLFSNGLLMGILVSLLLENLIRWAQFD